MKAIVTLIDGTVYTAKIDETQGFTATSLTGGSIHKFIGFDGKTAMLVQGNRISHIVIKQE